MQARWFLTGKGWWNAYKVAFSPEATDYAVRDALFVCPSVGHWYVIRPYQIIFRRLLQVDYSNCENDNILLWLFSRQFVAQRNQQHLLCLLRTTNIRLADKSMLLHDWKHVTAYSILFALKMKILSPQDLRSCSFIQYLIQSNSSSILFSLGMRRFPFTLKDLYLAQNTYTGYPNCLVVLHGILRHTRTYHKSVYRDRHFKKPFGCLCDFITTRDETRQILLSATPLSTSVIGIIIGYALDNYLQALQSVMVKALNFA